MGGGGGALTKSLIRLHLDISRPYACASSFDDDRKLVTINFS